MDEGGSKEEKSGAELEKIKKLKLREKWKQLCECEEIVSADTINAIGRITDDVIADEDNAPSTDELDEDLENEYEKLNDLLDLSYDSYSLTAIKAELPACIKYGIRSGLTHSNMLKFSPFSRGHQGGAIAIAAFATTAIYKSRCWNESVIDQIIEDGDTFYCESYKDVKTTDRRHLSILDLKRIVCVQKKFNVHVTIKDPSYAGKFRSHDPTELHSIKALELFFKRYNSGILTSPVLNLAIWKDPRYFSIFDGQARKENCEPAKDSEDGSAKLFLVKDLIGVYFIILEKSNVKNEPFVIYPISISGILPSSLIDVLDEPEKSLGKPQRRPSGYKIQEKFRAVIQGSYHLTHPVIPEILRGRGHLIIALAAIVYSCLVNTNKWTTALIDLIFNQSNIYLIDLARALDKNLADEEFELRLDDIMGDLILGVYSAKIKLQQNVIPGSGKKKGKLAIDSGIREFFATQRAGILDIKKFYYAIWKQNDTYYFMDPFACDEEGFRIDYSVERKKINGARDAACITMNSSINQMVETILENTLSKDKDPFFIHGIKVLYVKTGTVHEGPFEKIIYRERDTNRRPLAPLIESSKEIVEKKLDMTPTIRYELDKYYDAETQFPELMKNASQYMLRENEPRTFVTASKPVTKKITTDVDVDEVEEEEEKEEDEEEGRDIDVEKDKVESIIDSEIKQITGYNVINPHRLIVQGTKNCLHPDYKIRHRGRQGLIIALVGLAYRKLKDPSEWRNIDLDQIVDIGNKSYEDVINWIKDGKPKLKGEKEEGRKERRLDKEEEGAEEEEEEEEEVEEEEEEEVEEEEEKAAKILKMLPAPSHLDLSMLPIRLKFAENDVVFKTKMNLIAGYANPLVNLAEALECYFNDYMELILENKRLMYGIWKENNKYFLFNPYGSDKEGWRLLNYPASFAVVDTIKELTDIIYGILEYNENDFIIHFVSLDSIQPGKYTATEQHVEIPDDSMMRKFKTNFLPVTDNDLVQLEKDKLLKDMQLEKATVMTEDEVKGEDEGKEEMEEDEEEEEEEEEVEEEEDEEALIEAHLKVLEEAEKKPIICPLLVIEEKDQPDAPYRLNLILLTGNVKIQTEDEFTKKIIHPERILEKFKYIHPPPYVMPPKGTLCTLLDAKHAKRSIHSLVSRFSIDSKLEVKKKVDISVGNLQTKVHVLPLPDDSYKPTKIIKLNDKKYFYSRDLSICLMPLRAINDIYIHDIDLKKETTLISKDQGDGYVLEKIPDIPVGIRIMPELLPLGPIIKTPIYVERTITCNERKKRKCLLTKSEKGEPIMEKIICDTENVLFEMLFHNYKPLEQKDKSKMRIDTDDKIEIEKSAKTKSPKSKSSLEKKREGFKMIDDNIAILRSNMCLKNSAAIEPCHFKSCYYAAILCLLGKIRLNVNKFSDKNLDEFIYAADKIYQRVGKLRYKLLRWFNNFEILDTNYIVIMKQSVYADPENCESDKFENAMEYFMNNNETGILVTSNISYGFWKANDRYYFFDPYGCDEEGKSNEEGYACLMEFCDLSSMLNRMKENLGGSVDKPYRLYTMFIAHMETKCRKKKKRKKKTRYCMEKVEEEVEESVDLEYGKKSDSETSLIELIEWVTTGHKLDIAHDMTIPGFSPIRYYEASMLDVIVLENEITRPVLAPFKKNIHYGKENIDPRELIKSMIRKKIYDRKFKVHVSVITPIDLCIMAWSLIHDPILWSVRTIKGLFDASCDYTFDSILATEDSTVLDMSDGLLHEFEIANYIFRAVFLPLHYGILYAVEGWNLAMSLKYVFENLNYTGAIIVCEDSHIGVTKAKENYFAWWIVNRSKILRIITSTCIDEFLRIIIKEINQPEEIQFVMRVITISYAQKLDPDCSDVKGLHEFVVPTTSLAEIHKMEAEPYDLDAIFRPTVPEAKPIFINGTVALSDRETIKEPRVKRCYFVAILAVMIKRDVIQSPLPGMIDKMIEVAENLYREFHEPKFHTEHILRNVTLMNRIFDFRDCASCLIKLTVDSHNDRNDFYLQVRKYLKKHFMKYSSGIIQFGNCCYGFWYSRTTNSYYYLDPYQCNDKGRKVSINGKACLCIFSNICQMVRNMCLNQIKETTGFFIHRLHVESVNVSPFIEFQEDPMWIYLDYHWTFDHAPKIIKTYKRNLSKKRRKRKCYDKKEEEMGKTMKSYWNNYVIEVNDLIYSIWGTIGCYDIRFGNRAGKNQAAISVAILAMQYLSHPSRWNSAVLDSAVICGDSYYTESLKSSIRKCSKHSNRYNLQPCFKIFPHVWTINYQKSICGILYGGRNRLTLADALKMAFNDAPNILIECKKITLGALLSKDGYYVGDPCWIGPPLFNKDHGGIYVLRCKNFHSFVYAVTKMLNTNQRLEFRITPVIFTFEQEGFKLIDNKGHSLRKKILFEPLHTTPGKVEDYDVSIPGGQTVTEADSYLCYNRNLGLGITKGHELENIQLPSLTPELKKENLNSMLVSTTWHLNLGQSERITKPYPIFDPIILEHVPKECEERMIDTFEAYYYPKKSINDILNYCDDYPIEIDFMNHLNISTTSAETLTFDRPLECSKPRRFIADKSSFEFNKLTADMTDEIYKTYQHRLPRHKEILIVDDEKDLDLEISPIYTEETIDRKDDDIEPTEEIEPAEEIDLAEGTEPTEEPILETDVDETEATITDDE